MWIDTPVITHDRDYHSLDDYLNPAVPTDWTSPVDYADGDITICIELISAMSSPVYYLIGWTPGDGSDKYIRGGARFDDTTGFQEFRVPVAEFQRVVDGVDAGDVGDDWDWTQAFRAVNADTWGGDGPYPVRTRIRFILHPAP